jgi:hypothetical protein
VNEIFNERLKLTAAWMNQLATAVVAAGGFTPLAALLFGISSFEVSGTFIISVALNCFAFAAGLHLFGRWLLRQLK